MKLIFEDNTILPGAQLGVMGAGQLARMFAMAAQAMGFKVCVLDPAASGPAIDVADRHIQAAYDDPAGLKALAESCAVVTTEFENVPAESLAQLAQWTTVYPSAAAVSIAQDRIAEKTFFQSIDCPVTHFYPIRQESDLASIHPEIFPAILKTARMGYDGKGQIAVYTMEDLKAAWAQFQPNTMILEKKVALAAEVSVVLARSATGECVVFPVAENLHYQGILDRTQVPANQPIELQEAAKQMAQKIVENLQYCGVLCVEFFVTKDGQLLVNEMAPRPHNSGHFSIDACMTSQFEQQVRAITGLPLGSTEMLTPARMINLLGDIWFHSGVRAEPRWEQVLELPYVKLHLYGKSEPRLGRKMGHITICGASAKELDATVQRVIDCLKIYT